MDNIRIYSNDDITVVIMPRDSSPAPMEESGDESTSGITFLSGHCPDPSCQTKLYCLSSYPSIECTQCGQRHDLTALQNVKEEKGNVYNTALFAIKSLLAGIKPEPGTDNIKVHGLSNYKSKLLSPLLSEYGMDKTTGRAKLLTEMGQPPIFDCGVLCDRAFRIDPEHIDIAGYGRDRSGSARYLKDTLNVVQETNENEERLIPIHADGDGHCLVHAISRALVGRELFYYPLRLNLMCHLRDNLERYKELFKNFVDVDEWEDIISECHPNFIPKEGELAGLRNIHIFGLANVLKRPIILLDNPKGIESSGDYSGVFLPALLEPEQCKNKNGVLNFPLCIAWSSQGRNHFIPLVGVTGKPCPLLPRFMLQTTWGVDPTLLDHYIAFKDGCCTIGGPRMLQESYIQRLVSAMEEVFLENHKVHPGLVADVHQYIFRSKGFVGVTQEMVLKKTQDLVRDRMLLICIRCGCLTALNLEGKSLQRGGELYEEAVREVGELKGDKLYTFNKHQIVCRYDPEQDILVPDVSQNPCPFCKSENKFRYVQGDGSVEYREGDVTLEPAGPKSSCNCGFKHFYNGKFYDNRPRELPVPLEWGGKQSVDFVQWWENESDPQLNSNVYQVAQELIQKHFPGEFGIEVLEQKIVSAILHLTAIKEDKDTAESCEGPDYPRWNAEEASKIIMTGYQTQSIHKEELTKSDSERQLRKKIEANAPQQQSKRSAESSPKSHASPSARKSSASSSPARTASSKDTAAAKPSTQAPGTPPSTPKPADSDPPTPAPDTPPSTPKLTSGEKKVRIVAAGGRSETVTLTEELTYSQLQQVVYKAIQVPPEHQKLRLGFPPKVLAPPAPGEEDTIVTLNHGDKISVENTGQDRQGATKGVSQQAPSSQPPFSASAWGQFESRMPNEESMLQSLAARQSGGDSIDGAVVYLGLFAEQMGSELWALVQNQPHHFSAGGVYYRQAQRDVGLSADKHVTFPSLPGKCFAYNAALDRLELCLGEDVGHFAVEPDVEKKAREHVQRLGHGLDPHHTAAARPESGTVAGLRHGASEGAATFGSSGAVTKSHSSQGVFEGQGHTLRGSSSVEDVMPQDEVPLTGSIRGAARRLQDLCDPQHQASIDEEPEGMEVGEVKVKAQTDGAGTGDEGYPQPKYTRKGPGYSVLEPPAPPPPVEADAHMLQQLVQNLQETIAAVAANSMEEGEGEEEEEGQATQSDRESIELQPAEEVKTAEQIKAETLKAEAMETT